VAVVQRFDCIFKKKSLSASSESKVSYFCICNNCYQVVPKVEDIGPGFGRVAAVDEDGV
jgi:hypothetical protein